MHRGQSCVVGNDTDLGTLLYNGSPEVSFLAASWSFSLHEMQACNLGLRGSFPFP